MYNKKKNITKCFLTDAETLSPWNASVWFSISNRRVLTKMLCKGRKSNRLAKFQEKNLLRGAKALSGKKNPDSKMPNVKAKKELETPNARSMFFRILFIEYLKEGYHF